MVSVIRLAALRLLYKLLAPIGIGAEGLAAVAESSERGGAA